MNASVFAGESGVRAGFIAAPGRQDEIGNSIAGGCNDVGLIAVPAMLVGMITLIGASGTTGRLVAEQLRPTGCRVRIAARNKVKLKMLAAQLGDRFEYVRADVTTPSSLGTALESATTVINCAGPFTDLGEPVVRDCVRRGLNYLDTTGEQGFIRMVYERYGPEARKSQVALVPACAVEYALADAAAAMVAEQMQSCDEIQVAYCVHSMHASRGTKKSTIRALTSPGFWREDGEPKAIQPTQAHRQFLIPEEGKRHGYSFPGGEVFMLPLHMQVKSVSTYIILPLPPWIVTTVSAVAMTVMNSPIGKCFPPLIDVSGSGPSPAQRKAGMFEVVCVGSRENQKQSITVRASDPYGLTAVIVAGVATHIEQQGSEALGPVAPSMVAGYQLIKELTEQAGTVWTAQDVEG